MNNNVSKSQEFDLQLMINILLEEHQIDHLTAFELQKKSEIYCFEDLGIELTKSSEIDIKQIYDIIKRERIIPGNYHLVTIKTISKLKGLIGKWHSPVTGQMKISEVLEDVRHKSITLTQGGFYYFNGKASDPLSKGRYAYKLLIHNQIVIFINLNGGIAYRIIWKEPSNVKLCDL